MAIAASEVTQAKELTGLIGALFAFLLQLVQAGWFYRWRALPLGLPFIQDGLCILLVFLAVKAPQAGGIIALIILCLAVFSAKDLHRWYLLQQGLEVTLRGSDSKRTRR